ncbi:MAG: hypothetical protein HYX92_17855 [Chloroflexi bacterium]|nr:hypothetical protein [Chloroflexota bacterium]
MKNPEYFKKGLPYLDEIKYYIIKDESTRFGAFSTKSVLLDSKSPGFSPAQKDTLEKSPETAGKVVITGGINSLWGLWMNTKAQGPASDVRVRKALHLGIDRQKMQRLFAQSQPPGTIASTVYPGSKFAMAKETIEKLPGFRQPKDADIAEAKRLLEEAKLPKDYNMTLVTREGAIYRDQTTIVVEELKNLGINANIKILDAASLYAAQEKRDFATMVYTYSTPNPSPLSVFGDRFVTGGGRNYEGVSDPRIDSLFTKQERGMTRRSARNSSGRRTESSGRRSCPWRPSLGEQVQRLLEGSQRLRGDRSRLLRRQQHGGGLAG